MDSNFQLNIPKHFFSHFWQPWIMDCFCFCEDPGKSSPWKVSQPTCMVKKFNSSFLNKLFALFFCLFIIQGTVFRVSPKNDARKIMTEHHCLRGQPEDMIYSIVFFSFERHSLAIHVTMINSNSQRINSVGLLSNNYWLGRNIAIESPSTMNWFTML